MKKLITTSCLLFMMAYGAWAQSATPPGLRYPLWDWRFIRPGGTGIAGTLPQTIGYYMKEDTLSIKIEDGAGAGLTSDRMRIVLRAGSGITWRKELVAFSACTGARTQTIFTQDSRTVDSMDINRNDCTADTIIFRKAKLFGSMTDMYNLDINYFWKMLGGKIVTFTWTNDSSGNSQYPPSMSFPTIPLGAVPTAGELFDTDGKADIAVWRPDNGFWFPINSSDGSRPFKVLGASGDVPVPKDYDADGRTDMATWRPSTGEWRITYSYTGVTRVILFGKSGDIPVPGDYDGDGKIDLAFWRPSTGTWNIKYFMYGYTTTEAIQIGTNGDQPVPADYDGDHVTDLAVWQPSTGKWTIMFVDYSTTTRMWGKDGDVPVPADYDGDGKADLAIWRPSTGEWYITNSSNGLIRIDVWGQSGEQPLPRDYDGDAKADLAVWWPSTGEWFILNSSNGSMKYEMYGAATDIPVPTP